MTFEIHRAQVRGFTIAYVREGGGYPLVLLHGFPETKRIWWRNIAPLAEAGFEVIVPDLRGYGDSDVAPDGFCDAASMSMDVHALVHDVLGHGRCTAVGGDLGGVVAQDLANRYAGFVDRLVLFNTVPPNLPDLYAEAGLNDPDWSKVPTIDYVLRQGLEADLLIAELDTPEKRRRYIAGFYGHRLWASPGTFTQDDVPFHTEPFADADKLRSAFGSYETMLGTRPPVEPAKISQTIEVPTVLLFGPEDHVIPPVFKDRLELACTHPVGTFVIERCGHFLQWERADLLNRTLAAFCADLKLDAAAGR